MKPPAFQFYADDFLGGTVDLSAEDVGAYIRLICFQWNRGELPKDSTAIDRVAGCKVSDHVLAKFPSGKNKRLEAERQKQADYRSKQQQNAISGAHARWSKPKPTPQPEDAGGIVWHKPSDASPSPSPSPISMRESARAREDVQRPSLAEVLTYADRVGCAPWKASDWFNEMEGGGWLDFNHRTIAKWQAVFNRVRTKWEADGRPTQPPTNRGQNGNNSNHGTSSAPNRNAGTLNEGGHEQYRGVGEVG